jgi:hypothetical protein
MAKVGAPSSYTPELARKICAAVAVCTDPMEKICIDNGFPTVKCINGWRLDYAEFGLMYAQAKATQAELMAEETIEIAKNSRKNSTYIDDKGVSRIDPGAIAADRLVIDTQKWVACKLAPRIYGDKVNHEHTIKPHEDWLNILKE